MTPTNPTPPDMPELLPCPFCGGPAVMTMKPDTIIQCGAPWNKCALRQKFSIEEWNTRPTPPADAMMDFEPFDPSTARAGMAYFDKGEGTNWIFTKIENERACFESHCGKHKNTESIPYAVNWLVRNPKRDRLHPPAPVTDAQREAFDDMPNPMTNIPNGQTADETKEQIIEWAIKHWLTIRAAIKSFPVHDAESRLPVQKSRE